MLCPTCGTNTPGTLGTCSTCGTRLTGTAGQPLGAPVAEGTVLVPPPPSWASAPAPPRDAESTAAWTFDPDADRDEDVTRRTGPAPSVNGTYGLHGMPAAASGPPPPPPTWAEPEPDPTESIVPEDWYAKPRRPADDDRTRHVPPPAPEQPAWTPQNPQDWAPQGPPQGPPGWSPQPSDVTRAAPPMGGPMGPPPGNPFDPHYGPSEPLGPGAPAAPRRKGPPKVLIGGVAALVTVALVSVVIALRPDGKERNAAPQAQPSTSQPSRPVAEKNPIPAATRQQAAQINALLNTSGDARRNLTLGLNASNACKTLPRAIDRYQKVAQRRSAQFDRTRTLKVDKLPNGERMRSYLEQSYKASLEVDQALLAWAQKNRKCKGKPRPAAGQAPGRAAAEQRATVSKKRFVTLWNPVARKTGHPPRPWNAL
ncbi:hypothetical protein [Actinomadura flavalba]|uniref:hypothetical protein n=1 Tax=Actinomadura flavalba TaxID=1120938 RepID=UPI00039EA9CD|nr:hypothetical protein [Actinomadura flavalba]